MTEEDYSELILRDIPCIEKFSTIPRTNETDLQYAGHNWLGDKIAARWTD